MKGNFLPITREEMKERGWDQVDFVYVSGDAYVDHPSFGHAIITRLLESRGYRVGIIAQPDWRKPESVQVFGEPRLGFLVSAGNMDSMVNHYYVSKKHRKSLFCIQKEKKDRRLYTGRRDGKTTGLCLRSIWKSDSSDL